MHAMRLFLPICIRKQKQVFSLLAMRFVQHQPFAAKRMVLFCMPFYGKGV
jgi:hypothetical protein